MTSSPRKLARMLVVLKAVATALRTAFQGSSVGSVRIVWCLLGPENCTQHLPHISARCFDGLPGGVYNVPVSLIDKRIGGQAWHQHLFAGQPAREWVLNIISLVPCNDVMITSSSAWLPNCAGRSLSRLLCRKASATMAGSVTITTCAQQSSLTSDNLERILTAAMHNLMVCCHRRS